MEYKKISLLDNTPNQPFKFRTKNWVEVNDDICGNSMMKLSLCNYSDAFVLVSGTITVQNTETTAATSNWKIIIIKNCAPFTEINDTNKKC